MKIPLGDIVRALAKPGTWLARLFQWTKGITVRVGGHDVALDQKHGPTGGRSEFDDTPHRPGT